MRIGQLYTDVRLFPVTDPLQETIAKLNAFQPHYVHSYPSVFELIAQQKLADESITFAPELLSFSSESLLPGAEKTIRTAFPKAISRSIYATTECLPIAHACEHGNLHLNMDVCIVEPIARDGSPCTVGDFSDHVLLTSLENFCQPIIRYRLDDSIRFVPEKCLCNRPLPMIQVQGRTDDIFVLRNERGVEVEVPPVPLTFVLHKINGLSQFQIIQDTHRLIRVNFVVRSINESEAVAAKIKDRLQESIAKYGKFASVSIKTAIVDSIERTGSGQKLRQIVSNVKRS